MNRAQSAPQWGTGGRDQGGGDHVDQHQNSGGLRHFRGPISIPVETVLDRLEAVRRSPRGWITRCPAHEDRHQSLSVGEGRDGRALVNCFAGCTAEDVTRALGLELKDLFPPRDDRHLHQHHERRRRPSKPAVLPRSIAESLIETAEFCLMFEGAKALASLPPPLMKQDVVSAWDRLKHIGIDIPALVRLALLLRGIAFFHYCGPRRCEDSDIARAVTRLVDEIERAAA